MKLKMFSIFDQKAEVYMTPFFKNQIGEALRDFFDLVNDDQSRINKHPEDYSCFYLGEVDDQNGSVEGNKQPVNIGNAWELIKND